MPEELVATHEALLARRTLPRFIVEMCLLVLAEVGRVFECLLTF